MSLSRASTRGSYSRIEGVTRLCHASTRDSRCRVLQYVHDSLIVGGESDRNLYPSKVVFAYGSKQDLIVMLWLGFTLMIFGSCGFLLDFQS